MLERSPRLAAARNRQRRSRERRKLGRLLIGVEVDEFELIQALMQTGRLSEADAASRVRLKQAVDRLLADFIERWQARQTSTVTRGLDTRRCTGLKDDAAVGGK